MKKMTTVTFYEVSDLLKIQQFSKMFSQNISTGIYVDLSEF